VQIDEPTCRRGPKSERRSQALNGRYERALNGATAVHICFGYAAVIHFAPSVLFLGELAACTCGQVSIETASVEPDCSVLSRSRKEDHSRVIDLNDHDVETPEIVAARIRRALPYVRPEDVIVAPDCG